MTNVYVKKCNEVNEDLQLVCSRRLDCREQRKAARGARVGAREDWERGEETPVKLVLESSCRPILTADSGKEA